MSYLGDYAEDYADLNFKFSTRDSTGAPITFGGTPALSVYKSNGTTQSTAGITLSVDFDTVTGLHNCNIDLSADAFYAVGEDYAVVVTTGTVDGTSVVGMTLAYFSIENRWNEANVTQISGDSTAADNLEASLLGLTASTVNDGSATTTSFVTALSEATDDHYNGAFLLFTSGALIGQSRKISDYNGTTKAVTVSAFTEAPANTDSFVILGRSE